MTSSQLTTIPFKMEIKQYFPDGTFVVEFTPDDPDCYPIEHAVTIPLDTNPPPTTSDMLAMIAGASPQHYWNQLKAAATIDHTLRESLIGQVVDNANQLINTQTMSNDPAPTDMGTGLSQQDLQVLSTTLIVQQVLAEMVGATI